MKFEVSLPYSMQMTLKSMLVTPEPEHKIVPFAQQDGSPFWQECACASKVCLVCGETNRNRWITLCVIHPIMREQSLSGKMRSIGRAPELTFEGPTIRYTKITRA